jgi:hypothetical protein
MPKVLPPEIEIVTTPQGERYDMPARQVGCVRIAAIPMLLIGAVFGSAGLYTALIEGGLWGLINASSTGKPFDLFLAILGLLFVFIGLGGLYLGIMLVGGRSVIEFRDERLILTQRSGIARWRRMVPLDSISKFQLKSSNTDDATVAIGSALSALNVVTTGDKLYNVAWGYPKPMLRALADTLAEQCETTKGARLMAGDVGDIAVEERTLGQDRLIDTLADARGADNDFENDTVPQQPANSLIILKPNDAGVTITVPPVGVRKGGKGMFGFSIFWNGFMTVFTGFWVSGGIDDVSEFLIVVAFLSLFWAVGIGMLVAAINAGRRQAILDVVGDTLLITRQNIFKTRQQEVPRDNIKSIRRDKSGVEVNDVPVLNLQIRLHEGKKISMFSQLANDELRWVAAVLREALDLPDK